MTELSAGMADGVVDESTASSAPQDYRRVLWRMQGPARVVAATLSSRPDAGTELRIFFEPEESGDILGRHFEERTYRIRRLERRAARLRDALRDQGWIPLPIPAADSQAAPVRYGLWLKVAAFTGISLFAAGRWAFGRKPPVAADEP